jgi:glycosyltransferase involved in cell wall biosynthesis
MNIPPPPAIPPPPVAGQPRPFWSVMIPTYRPKEKILRQTLESVLQQDAGADAMQIEVVDDCSPDVDVAAMVRAIAGGRVKFSQTPKNLGLAGAWNTCIGRACGEWVHILHQDDYLLPGFYARLRRAMDTHPNAALVASRSNYVNEAGTVFRVTPRVAALEQGERAVEEFFYTNPIECPGVVMRRKFYEEHGGFRTDMVFALDAEMWTRAFGLAGGVVVPEALACFRISSGQASDRLERSGDTLRDFELGTQIAAERYPTFDRNHARQLICNKALDQVIQFGRTGHFAAARTSWNHLEIHLPGASRYVALVRRMLVWVSWWLQKHFEDGKRPPR